MRFNGAGAASKENFDTRDRQSCHAADTFKVTAVECEQFWYSKYTPVISYGIVDARQAADDDKLQWVRTSDARRDKPGGEVALGLYRLLV